MINEPLTKYEILEMIYKSSQQVCDPRERQLRQLHLLETLAEYILDRDKPQEGWVAKEDTEINL